MSKKISKKFQKSHKKSLENVSLNNTKRSKNNLENIGLKSKLVAKKKFGQNFLVNTGVKEKIKKNIEILLREYLEFKNLIEIGPGKGDITIFLLRMNKHFKAIEIDPEAITFLQNKFDNQLDESNLELNSGVVGKNITLKSEKPNIKIKNLKTLKKENSQLKKTQKENIETGKNQILTKNWLEFGDALQLVTQKKLPFKNFVLFSSLPYNVASRILVEMAINYPNCPFCVIVQKEVAMKLIDDKLTFFGAFLRLFYNFEKVFDINGGSFDPAPKVMSSLLIGRPRVEQDLEQKTSNLDNLESKNLNIKESKQKDMQINTLNLNLFLVKIENREIICNILKKLVANPRKTLANNLANLNWKKSKIEEFINKYNYQKTRLLYSNYQKILFQILTENET